MNILMRNGYAKKSTDSTTEGKCWYISHHGVYNANKPNEIRVVFDCSTEYQKRSLNNELMSGPDLTNQIIGVLIRFRQVPIAIMADIKSMFYQMRVSQSGLFGPSFLIFLESDFALLWYETLHSELA